MKYHNTITQISVGLNSDNPIFGDCIHVKLEDDAGGMFLVLKQFQEDQTHEVRISFDEWDSVCQAVFTLRNQPLVK